jgi:glycosyltransferase involved in cell wall biosynthesis
MILSVVIPTYNRFTLLKQCLAALLRQQPEKDLVEIIVADDASASVCREKNRHFCEGAKIRYTCSRTNRGPAAARNAGSALGSGRWVAFLDDDVCVAPTWVKDVLRYCAGPAPDIVGIEGKIVAQGQGLWDREVENLSGGLYLTGNIIYKRDILLGAGGFDETFRGPFCEDQELAARMLLYGRIVFEPALQVFHQPRRTSPFSYFLSSAGRIKMLLDSEFYFYRKHRDRYHVFRFAKDFWHTLLAICLKNVYITLKRRRVRSLFKHPGQALILTLAALIEQCIASLLFLRYLRLWFFRPGIFFPVLIDCAASARLWGLRKTPATKDFFLKINVLKTLLNPGYRKASFSYVDSVKRFLNRTGGGREVPRRIFVRMDDMFFDKGYDYQHFAELMSRKNVPFLAAITGNDLRQGENWPLLMALHKTGAVIALHGFTHRGTFGPYQSEILQMKLPELNAACREVFESGLPFSLQPEAFVPPFNAMSRYHILAMDPRFKVICGGPENIRFTGYTLGPVMLNNGTVYFPAFQPFCCSARKMLTKGVPGLFKKLQGILCLNFHYIDELQDGFKAFDTILDACSENLESWDYFLKGASSRAHLAGSGN